jgi:hypothetical protein
MKKSSKRREIQIKRHVEREKGIESKGGWGKGMGDRGVRGGGMAYDQQRHCGKCNITEKVRMSLNSIEVNNDLVALTSVATIGAFSDFPS